MNVDTCGVFQYINALPDVAVYAVVNHNTKIVYSIMHTTKLKTKLGEIGEKLADGCVFEYFEISAHPVYKLIMSEQIRLKYINRGYSIANQISPFIKFTPSVQIDVHYVNTIVYITSSRGLREVAGVFKKLKDAEEFLVEYYGKDWGGLPVYAINKETRAYWQNLMFKGMYGGRHNYPMVESSVSDADI